jgi:hypothetical protein
MDKDEVRRLLQAARDSLERLDISISKEYLNAALQECE